MSRKGGLNLDLLFGNVYNNIVGEPITPQKVAIFYLIKQLFRSHFGYRAVPSTRQFTVHDKTKIFAVLFGLITLGSDITYERFRKIVRYLDTDVRRGIYHTFVVCMEKIAQGEENVDIRVEDSLYTGKREYHELAVYELPPTKPLLFMNTKSYAYIWLKRIMAQWLRSTQEETYRINETMRFWLNPRIPDLLNFRPKTELPHPINCSTRAREWIMIHLHLIQLSPSRISLDKILELCKVVAKYHVDVYPVFLLEALVHVQLQNPKMAIKAIKKFFDMTMLKINDNVISASQSHKLAVPCQRPLRFAPLLQGRVCRLFGDTRTAQTLLNESIRQAQLSLDETCNRMANIELTAIEVLRSGPLLELPHQYDYPETERDKRVVQQNIHRGAELDDHTNMDTFPNDQEENFELHEQLIAMAKALCIMEDMLLARYYIKSAEHMETGLRVNACGDHAQKTKRVNDCSIAIAISNLLRNGMYHHTLRSCQAMINTNFDAEWCWAHETEAYAVTAVNMVYACAATGRFKKASMILERIEKIYPEHCNWQSARHVKICRLIFDFERSFLHGNYEECKNIIRVMTPVAQSEAILRKALILAITGNLTEGLSLLMEYKTPDVLTKLRINMQMATINIQLGQLDIAEQLLEECVKIASSTTLRNIRAMVARRVSYILLLRRDYRRCLKLLVSISEQVATFANITEKILYNFTVARTLRLSRKDPTTFLASAREDASLCEWKNMEKLILAEAAIYYDSIDGVELREKTCGLFNDLETEKSQAMPWMLI